MICLTSAFTQHYPAADLPGAVRQMIGKPLRRASALTQLALVGTLAAVPPARHNLPTALLWQTTRGPLAETQRLLIELAGSGDPMPYDFLAMQPAITAAQIHPFFPGLSMACPMPMESETTTQWHMLLMLAMAWLNEERYEQVLCAHLDLRHEQATSAWLSLTHRRHLLEKPLARLNMTDQQSGAADTPDLPDRIAQAMTDGLSPFIITPPAGFTRTLEFIQL